MTASGQSRHIDRLPAAVALELMLASQIAAAQSVSTALPMIELAAKAVAVTLRAGKTVIYAAAGSSGLMALADAAELPGTFGISPDQIRIAMAGGIPVDARMPGDTEDETGSAEAVADRINAGDALIVLSA
ncbi:MAG: N-acetylmuramic acid 6-phosphate etherase, partial [Pseudorhodobacter sp.]|nr:N-acetylmuramic acid 6-phosphate etherase [Pseudorhodobacter sp.]